MFEKLARSGIKKYVAAYDQTLAQYPGLTAEVGAVIVAISENRIDPADAVQHGVSDEDKHSAIFAIEYLACVSDTEKKSHVERFNEMSDIASKSNLPTSLFMAPRILSSYIRSTMLKEARALQNQSSLSLSDIMGEPPLHLSIFHRIRSAINIAKEV